MESIHTHNNEQPKVDVRSQKELSPLDGELLTVRNTIIKLETDLAGEKNPSKIGALNAILEEEVAKKQALLDKKFATAQPEQSEPVEVSFDDAHNANGGAALFSREDRSERRQII